MDAFKQWWEQASTRDQLALLIGGSFLAVYILFVAVLKPVHQMRVKEETKNNALRSSLENVRGLAAQVVAMNRGASDEGQSNSIERVIQQTVAANGLQVASMASSGKDGVRLRFDGARFENVLRWLYEIEVTYSYRIKDLSVAPASSPGTVAVNLRIHQN